MAFGFFKKSEAADIIYTGGRIYTQNPELPWAEAVACKDGLILAVGDAEDLAEFEGKHTQVVNLDGKFMLPGYIDTCGHPVTHSFRDSCLFLAGGGLDEILAQISEYASAKAEAEILFAYGYDESILKDVPAEQIRARLDAICPDKPVVILGKSGFHCFVNTVAMEIVKTAAEEDEIGNAVTISYILGVLQPLDIDSIPETVPEIMRKYGERGFTSVFDCGAPDYFASLYQSFMVHFYQENMLRQRFFGSLLILRDVNPKGVMYKLSQLRTNCVELNGYVNFKTLKMIVGGDEENLSISSDVLRELCVEAGDKGFDVHIDALGEDAVDWSIEAMGAARTAGYKKNALILAHSEVADPQTLTDDCYQLDIAESVSTLVTDDDWLCIEGTRSVEEAVDMLTIDAALMLGIGNEYGSIDKGKHADFAVFEENPLEAKTLDEFKNIRASMTILDGAVVYDAEGD